MEISEDKKIDILLSVYSARLSQVDQIRNRGVSLLLWVAAIFVFVSGYVIKSNGETVFQQKVMVLCVLWSFIGVLCYQLKTLMRGFRNHLHILVKVEVSLKLYEKGVYSDEALFPKKWKDPKRVPQFFKFIYMAVLSLSLLLSIIVWFSGGLF